MLDQTARVSPDQHPGHVVDLIGTPGVASSVPYNITGIPGAAPAIVADFIGATSFLIEVDGHSCQIDGVGAANGTAVRFYQKDQNHDGRDVRIWHIAAGAGTGCTAEHRAAM